MRPVSRMLDTCASLGLFDASGGPPDAITGHGLINLLSGTDDQQDHGHRQWSRMVWNASGSDKWRGDQMQRVDLLVTFFTRKSVADWLRNIGETPGSLTPEAKAWLDDSLHAGIAGRRRERVRQILDQLRELDPDLSFDSMPGTKADFLALCRRVDGQMFRSGADAFDTAIKGVCKFLPGAKSGRYYADKLMG